MISLQASYSFEAGGAGTRLLRGGWRPPASQGVWTDGDEGTLVVPAAPGRVVPAAPGRVVPAAPGRVDPAAPGRVVPAAPGRGALFLDVCLDTQPVFGITRLCQVTIFIAGAEAGTRRLGGLGWWRVPVPDAVADGDIHVSIEAQAAGPGGWRGIQLRRIDVLRDTHAELPAPVRPMAEIRFGWNEPTEALVPRDAGWGTPEDAFVWAVGGASVLHLPVAGDGAPVLALLDMRPHTRSGAPERQRVAVWADGVPVAALSLWERLIVAIDVPTAPGRKFVALRFENLDAAFDTSEPYHHFGKPFAWALASIRLVPPLPRYLPGARPRVPGRIADGSMPAKVRHLTGLDAADVPALFEGLGNGCELGQLQQRTGQNNPGLLRFVAVRQRDLVEGLFAGFRGVGRLDRLKWRVRQEDDTTWRLIEDSYGLSTPTPHDRFVAAPDGELSKAARRMARLADKLMEDVARGERIFLMRFGEPGGEAAARAVLAALRHYGEADMVWLVDDGRRQPGSVERLECGLIRGNLDLQDKALQGSPDTMLSILANAVVLLRQTARLT